MFQSFIIFVSCNPQNESETKLATLEYNMEKNAIHSRLTHSSVPHILISTNPGVLFVTGIISGNRWSIVLSNKTWLNFKNHSRADRRCSIFFKIIFLLICLYLYYVDTLNKKLALEDTEHEIHTTVHFWYSICFSFFLH